ncbi:hypothetical protein DRE_05261 [Drechslerella stenobrocha 248]|uniref:Enoyl reductase (ER) domain-containing protein n=1 Tax=Drechslerella stenobrocha 248 TaxID=1043628 RepID=W7I9J0_9PEZI|nr:hypothetical protein DRE_05261 [Drechslerella stenobrocha 248]
MKGLKLDAPRGEYQLVDDLPEPSPGPNQLLVKPIYGSINPVDELMRNSGLLIVSWPWTPCCDVAGTVVKVGDNVTKFKAGDQVFGCQGLGFPGSGGAAEYCLFREDLALRKPEDVPLAAAASIGVGSETAAMGVWVGLNIQLPDPQNLPATSDEWVFILGGGGNVGAYAVQLAKLSGYKVIASVSSRSVQSAIAAGADETVDYKDSVDSQIAKIKAVTKGGLHRIFDATSFNKPIVEKLLESTKDEPGQKYFTTVNNWDDFSDLPGSPQVHLISLGPVAREDAEHAELNASVSKAVVVIEQLLALGKLIVNEYVVADDTGFEAFTAGTKLQSTKAAKKVVVKFQSE